MIGLAAALVLATAKGAPSALFQGDKTYKATCTLFVLKDCPIANQYMPEVKRIKAKYTSAGIQFQIVFEDPGIDGARIQKYFEDFQVSFPAIMDGDHRLARRLGATISPTAVLRSRGKVFYVGRIDDQYAALGKRRTVSKSHDLRDALDQFLAGKKIKTPKTEAVGCRLY